MEKADMDYCEKWMKDGDEDGSAIEWMRDVKECTVPKCPFTVKEKYVEKYSEQFIRFWGRPNMTICKHAVHGDDALSIYPRSYFDVCVDYMMFLIDLPDDPSKEECEERNNWMLNGNKEYRGYRGSKFDYPTRSYVEYRAWLMAPGNAEKSSLLDITSEISIDLHQTLCFCQCIRGKKRISN